MRVMASGFRPTVSSLKGIATAALAVVFMAAGAVALAQGTGGHGHDRSATAAAPFQGAMMAAMDRMMRDMHAAPMLGDPDRDFLAMMIPHHEGAVEMARLVLLHGHDPLVRRMAEEILSGQQTAIAAMRARLAILGRGTQGEYPSPSGTRAPAAGR